MCGIVGYASTKDNAFSFIKEGIKRVSHRGYDSFGMGFMTGDTVNFVHAVGHVDDKMHFNTLEQWQEMYSSENLGLGHTRWATSGEVSCENAHPQVGMCGSAAVCLVHNGTIADWQNKIKEVKGEFPPKTDTQLLTRVLATELEPYASDKDGGYSEAIYRAIPGPSKDDKKKTIALMICNIVQEKIGNVGAYAFMTSFLPGHIIMYTNGPSLYIGANGSELFIASEASVLHGYAEKCYRISNNTPWCINKNYEITISKDKDQHIIDNPISLPSSYLNNELSLGDREFSYHMEKEIYEQAYLEPSDDVLHRFPGVGNTPIVFFGCGSSYHAGLIGAQLLRDWGIDAQAVQSSYLNSTSFISMNLYSENTLFVALSQSGETKDTIDALERISFQRVGCITNSPKSSISTLVNSDPWTIDIDVGKEIGVASTKTTLATIMAIDSIASKRSIDAMYCNVRQAVKTALGLSEDIERLVHAKLCCNTNMLFLSSGIGYPIVQEAALKMKEVAYVHAEAMYASEMKHGPIALIDKEMPCLFLIIGDDKIEEIEINIDEVKTRGGSVIRISDVDHKDNDITISHLYSHVGALVVMQLLAFYSSIVRGNNVDRPRNLAKTVTV